MEMKMMDKLKNLDEWNGNGEFQARTSAQRMMRAAEGAGTACGSACGAADPEKIRGTGQLSAHIQAVVQHLFHIAIGHLSQLFTAVFRKYVAVPVPLIAVVCYVPLKGEIRVHSVFLRYVGWLLWSGYLWRRGGVGLVRVRTGFYLSGTDAPQGELQAPGGCSGSEVPPHAVGLFSGSDAPQAEPHAPGFIIKMEGVSQNGEGDFILFQQFQQPPEIRVQNGVASGYVKWDSISRHISILLVTMHFLQNSKKHLPVRKPEDAQSLSISFYKKNLSERIRRIPEYRQREPARRSLHIHEPAIF